MSRPRARQANSSPKILQKVAPKHGESSVYNQSHDGLNKPSGTVKYYFQ